MEEESLSSFVVKVSVRNFPSFSLLAENLKFKLRFFKETFTYIKSCWDGKLDKGERKEKSTYTPLAVMCTLSSDRDERSFERTI